MQVELKEKDGRVDAELRDVFEVMKMSEEKKMGRVKRGCVFGKSVELWKRCDDGCVCRCVRCSGGCVRRV